MPELEQKTILTKNPKFKLEQEYRLCDSGSTSFSSFERSSTGKSPTERLMHFKKGQLKGIIFGIRMEESEKAEIEKIVDRQNYSLRLYDAIQAGNGIETRLK